MLLIEILFYLIIEDCVVNEIFLIYKLSGLNDYVVNDGVLIFLLFEKYRILII